jgi:hypothetical protein
VCTRHAAMGTRFRKVAIALVRRICLKGAVPILD